MPTPIPDHILLVISLVIYLLGYLGYRLINKLLARKENKEHPALGELYRFMVFNPTWPDPPRFAYKHLDEARKVAEKLSRKQPKDQFFVMKAVLQVGAVPQVTELPGGNT